MREWLKSYGVPVAFLAAGCIAIVVLAVLCVQTTDRCWVKIERLERSIKALEKGQ